LFRAEPNDIFELVNCELIDEAAATRLALVEAVSTKYNADAEPDYLRSKLSELHSWPVPLQSFVTLKFIECSRLTSMDDLAVELADFFTTALVIEVDNGLVAAFCVFLRLRAVVVDVVIVTIVCGRDGGTDKCLTDLFAVNDCAGDDENVSNFGFSFNSC
jgi:hypothetical protein